MSLSNHRFAPSAGNGDTARAAVVGCAARPSLGLRATRSAKGN